MLAERKDTKWEPNYKQIQNIGSDTKSTFNHLPIFFGKTYENRDKIHSLPHIFSRLFWGWMEGSFLYLVLTYWGPRTAHPVA